MAIKVHTRDSKTWTLQNFESPDHLIDYGLQACRKLNSKNDYIHLKPSDLDIWLYDENSEVSVRYNDIVAIEQA